MKYEPHDYQKFAADFILSHPAAAVFLDLGLGKTVITLDAVRKLLKGEIQHVLVIAPKRVAVSTWPSEIEKWDEMKSLTYSVAVGTAEERRRAVKAKSQITIINRENLSWLIEESGIPFYWDMIVIDELSSFKSGKAKRFKSLLKVRPQVKRIVGLTGTPSSNSLMDLWAEFRVLDMGKRLGRYITQYRNRFFLPDKRNANIIFSYKPKDGAEDEIYKLISDMTVSMRLLFIFI